MNPTLHLPMKMLPRKMPRHSLPNSEIVNGSLLDLPMPSDKTLKRSAKPTSPNWQAERNVV